MFPSKAFSYERFLKTEKMINSRGCDSDVKFSDHNLIMNYDPNFSDCFWTVLVSFTNCRKKTCGTAVLFAKALTKYF